MPSTIDSTTPYNDLPDIVQQVFKVEADKQATANAQRRPGRGDRQVGHNRTKHSKHVERRHFFIRDMVEKFELRVPLVSTVNNYADFFTKPLKSKAFFGLRNKIMNIA